MKKIKVALITHFSNLKVREKLDLLPSGRHYRYHDMAGWNNCIINGLKEREEVELYVISAHIGMRKTTQEFEMNGVHYYFFNPDYRYPWAYFDHFIFSQKVRNYPRNRRLVKSFIDKIQPDIVNLIGAENSYYSITALDIKTCPVILQLQTVYANPDRIRNTGKIDKERWEVEVSLFKNVPYVACTGRMYYDLVKDYNSESIIFPRRWPVAKFPIIGDVSKKYDFVYFARYLGKGKGFDNAVEAMGMFIKVHPEVKILAIGSKSGDWAYYEKRINELGLINNLEIHAPIADYQDLLKFVKQSRFSLLPITMDVISGTILESMRMGMPVVTCRTSGTPSLNLKRETVLISEIGDSNELFNNMLKLYEDPGLQNRLRDNAYKYIEEMDDRNNQNAKVMVEQFKAVINHYRYGTTIPTELLYNLEENKDYRKNEDNKN